MRLSYDPRADVLYIRLRRAAVKYSEDVGPGVSATFDDTGQVIGFEVRSARKRLSLEELTSVSYENTSLNRRNSVSLP